MVDKKVISPSLDPESLALMLCESLLHVLVEEGVLSTEKAIEVIETVAELIPEVAETGSFPEPISEDPSRSGRQQASAATAIIDSMRRSFAVKSPAKADRRRHSN